MTNGNYDSIIADVHDEEPVVEFERDFFIEGEFASTIVALWELGLGHNMKIGASIELSRLQRSQRFSPLNQVSSFDIALTKYGQIYLLVVSRGYFDLHLHLH